MILLTGASDILRVVTDSAATLDVVAGYIEISTTTGDV